MIIECKKLNWKGIIITEDHRKEVNQGGNKSNIQYIKWIILMIIEINGLKAVRANSIYMTVTNQSIVKLL